MRRNTHQLTDRMIDVVSGAASAADAAKERRRKRRLPYHARVALVLIGPNGRTRPIVLRARDLSHDGMCVVSRSMMYPGSCGAVQLVRSNGEAAIVGVQVRHCRYAGEMQHYVGLKFIPLVEDLPSNVFLDEQGRMIILDDSLRR